jgi:putative redox protein
VSEQPVAEIVSQPKPPSRVHIDWLGEHRFDAGRPGGPTLRLDSTGKTGQSPPDALLSALAVCTGIDVVDVLAKRRTPVSRFTIDVEGDRVNTIPRRFSHIRLVYHIDGEGIEAVHAERAIDLSITKYCTVRSSLRPDIIVEWSMVLNGGAATAYRPG